MNWDEVIEKSQNRSYDEIQDMALILRQSIRCTLSRLLMDTDGEHPIDCSIEVPIGYLTYKITAIYQHPTGGEINCYIKEDERYEELDFFTLDAQLVILEGIWNDK